MSKVVTDIVESGECTGCKACGDVCPEKVIDYIVDGMGFWRAHIQMDKCANCGKCVKVCPALVADKYKREKEPIVYAAWSKYGDIRRKSTSGGVFWEIATAFMNTGGVVCGCVWNDGYKSARHFIANNYDELQRIRGSKYIQSETEGIYLEIKNQLDEGKKVLFCGTPCQNVALRLFLGGNYADKVYYLDFICRSVNSPLAYKAYIEELEKKHDSKVIQVQLKNKKKGWMSLATYAKFENGSEWLCDKEEDYWINGFICHDLYTRESCGNCKFRTIPRSSADITLGDFWGIQGQTNYDYHLGISVVMINDSKGQQLFDDARESLYSEKRTINEVLQGNMALIKNPVLNKEKQERFFDYLKSNSFSAAYKCVEGDISRTSDESEDGLLKEDKEKYLLEGIIDEDAYRYLNFHCKNVIRKGRGRIIPFEHAVLDLHATSRIVFEGDENILLGTNLFKGSKAETLIRLAKNAYWIMHHGGYLFFDTTVDIKEDAILETGFFSANTGSVIVCSKHICLGEDVMMGRNVIIYDSDFHQIGKNSGAEKVVIEDHVWLTGNINVNKGVRVGEGSIVASQTVLNKDVPKYSLVAGKAIGTVVRSDVSWKRTTANPYVEDMETKRIILYGFGKEGQLFYQSYFDYVDYIVDDCSKEDRCITLNQFYCKHNALDDEKYCWVIADKENYDKIFHQIRSRYYRMTILSAEKAGIILKKRFDEMTEGHELEWLGRRTEEFLEKKIILFGYGIVGKDFYKKHRNRIAYVIDNYDEADECVTYSEFCSKNPKLNEFDYVWVIASPNYYDGIYKQIRMNYKNAVIASAEEVVNAELIKTEVGQ